MKKAVLRSLSGRLFCLLMALHVLNFSVDPPDTHVHTTASGAVREDLSVNEMESIGEWILEHLLGLTDAVPEQDEAEDAGKITKDFSYWIAPAAPLAFLLPASTDMIPPVRFAFRVSFASSCLPEVVSPPPWRA